MRTLLFMAVGLVVARQLITQATHGIKIESVQPGNKSCQDGSVLKTRHLPDCFYPSYLGSDRTDTGPPSEIRSSFDAGIERVYAQCVHADIADHVGRHACCGIRTGTRGEWRSGAERHLHGPEPLLALENRGDTWWGIA